MSTPYTLLKMGHPLLTQRVKPVSPLEFGTDALKAATDLLLMAMHQEGGVGLAAPQIGIDKRIIAIGIGEHTRNKRDIQIESQILINPMIIPQSDEQEESYESCLSVDKMIGKVSRYHHIICQSRDIDGHIITQEVYGLHARILQHEVDHLNGLLFLERVQDKNNIVHPDDIKKTSYNNG